VGQNVSNAKGICWDWLKYFLADLTKAGIIQFNSNDLTVRCTTNGNVLKLTGVEEPERLRGNHYSGIVTDESQGISEEVWDKIISPTTRQRRAWILMLGTPKGPQGVFYRQYCAGLDPTNKGWTTIVQGVLDTGEMDPDEWADILANTPKNVVDQEFHCSFDAEIENKVFYNFDSRPALPIEENQVPHIDAEVEDRGEELYIGMDFNTGHYPAVIAQKSRDGNSLEIFAELLLKNATTDMMADAIKRNWPNRRIYICPDASGNQMTTGSTQGSNIELLRQAGFIILAPRKNPPVADRVLACNVLLQSADGRRRVKIHPRCKELLRSLTFHELNPTTGAPDKSRGLDHFSDAFGYLVCQTFPIQKTKFKRKGLRL
jgi:hypothetical protein